MIYKIYPELKGKEVKEVILSEKGELCIYFEDNYELHLNREGKGVDINCWQGETKIGEENYI